jgi:hypothetical protein
MVEKPPQGPDGPGIRGDGARRAPYQTIQEKGAGAERLHPLPFRPFECRYRKLPITGIRNSYRPTFTARFTTGSPSSKRVM